MTARALAWSTAALLLLVATVRASGRVPPLPADGGTVAARDPGPSPSGFITVQGRLAGEARAELERARPDPRGAVIVFVRQDEVYTCEDLGRQLRELARRLGRGSPLVVWTEPESAARVTAYLKQEKVRHHLIVSPRLERLFARGSLPATPSAVIVGAEGWMRGVAHPLPAANVRTVSFADEMAPLAREVAMGQE